MPWTVAPVQDLFELTEVEVQVETAIEIDVSAGL
jgi:ribonuclease HII